MNTRTYSNAPAPFPKNFQEMCAAANDPTEFAKQQAIYAKQCADEGYFEPDSALPSVVGDRYRDRKDLDL